MTREEAKRRAELYSALAEGKTIQYLDDRGFWNDIKTCVSFDYNISCYRIKPEPKYRPFETQEECWEEMHKHPDFGWLKSKERDEIAIIGRVFTSNGKVFITWSTNEGLNIKVSEIFNYYTFIDGTPFGVKEE